MEWSETPPKYYRGLNSEDVAIRVLGRDESGRLDIQLNVKVPDTDDQDLADRRQMEAIHDVFPHIPNTITANQAHALISYCEFSRVLMREYLSSYSGSEASLWISIIATLVSHDTQAGGQIVSWNLNRHRYGTAQNDVKDVPLFDDLISVCQIIEKEMSV
jgi:hypothetical protein